MSKTKNTEQNQVKKAEVADPQKRDFMVLSASAMAGVGAVAAAVPLVNSMNPAKDVQALASIEVNISGLEPGDEMKVKWRGKPVFIKRRTATELKEAREVPLSDLPDPETDWRAAQPVAGREVHNCTWANPFGVGQGSGVIAVVGVNRWPVDPDAFT